MTIYQKKLIELIKDKFGELSASQMASQMFELGVLDHTLCKVMIIRNDVSDRIKKGVKKIDAMWEVAENYACTYEYVRKCMYYYKDINI